MRRRGESNCGVFASTRPSPSSISCRSPAAAPNLAYDLGTLGGQPVVVLAHVDQRLVGCACHEQDPRRRLREPDERQLDQPIGRVVAKVEGGLPICPAALMRLHSNGWGLPNRLLHCVTEWVRSTCLLAC
jgi:hypothetical protein